MKETRFISQNKEKWRESEALLDAARKNPGKLSELFTQVVDDLSYSRTYYPNRSVRVYLNKIAREYFSIIYGNQKGKAGRFRLFWTEEIPQIVIHCKIPLLISLIVFLTSVAIGVFSAYHDPEFASTFFGPGYVEMTKSNIEQGDPMAVYKRGHQVDMFLGITFNNLMVAVRAYIFGVLLSIGTIVILIVNGVMVGCFQYFFIQRDLFVESALTIWLHGTLEMASFVIAGGAGMTLGSGLLFPGTYSRLQAFQISAIRSLKLMISIAPIIVTAGIIESFLTRYTEVPDFVRLFLILMSLTLIIGYYLVYPWMKSRKGFVAPLKEVKLPASVNQPIDFTRIKTNSDILKDAFFFYRTKFSKFISWIAGVSLLTTAADLFFEHRVSDGRFYDWWETYISQLFYVLDTPTLTFVAVNALGFMIIVYRVMKLADRDVNPQAKFFQLPMILQTLIVSGVLFAMLFFLRGWGLFLFSMTFMLLMLVLYAIIGEQKNLFSAIGKAWTMAAANFGQFIGLQVTLLLMAFSFLLILSSPLIYLYSVVFNWSFTQSDWWSKMILQFVELYIKIFSFNLVLPLIAVSAVYLFHSMKELHGAAYLRKTIASVSARYNKTGTR